MNSTEINEVIENLCQKFGTVREQLFPEIARMHVASNTVNTVLSLILLIVMILIVRNGFIAQNDESISYDARENWEFASFFGAFIGICFLVAFWCNLYELVQWVLAPTAKTVEYVLQLL